MPSELMAYENDFFDFILARDILHHVDIPKTINEIRRVAKSGALFLVNEIYSHSITDRIRHSNIVEKVLYPKMQKWIYGEEKPYITQDERKLTELDIQEITKSLQAIEFKKYFNFLVTRIIPDDYLIRSKIDRLLLIALKPLAYLIPCRVLFAGHIAKT